METRHACIALVLNHMNQQKLDEILHEIPTDTSPLHQKANFIYAILQPHGLERSGAKRLAHVEGIVRFLKQERLDANPKQFPSLPLDVAHPYQLCMRACQALQDYLGGYGLHISSLASKESEVLLTVAWPDYRALTLYCQEKSALSMPKTKTVV